MAPFMFCRVCRINHDKGKGHKYGVKHKQYLADFLSKARTKIEDIRSSLKEGSLLQDEGRGRTKFWCSFCELEVHEKGNVFARYVSFCFVIIILTQIYLRVGASRLVSKDLATSFRVSSAVVVKPLFILTFLVTWSLRHELVKAPSSTSEVHHISQA